MELECNDNTVSMLSHSVLPDHNLKSSILFFGLEYFFMLLIGQNIFKYFWGDYPIFSILFVGFTSVQNINVSYQCVIPKRLYRPPWSAAFFLLHSS